MEMDGTDAPGPTPADDGSEERIRGLGEQFGRFRQAVRRLVTAHLDLARAELGEIAAEVRRFAGLVGLALGFVFFAVLLLAVGLPLFLGDWLFGSLGWGLAHGVLMVVALAIAAVGAALGATGRAVWLPFISGVAVAVAVALVLGTNIAADALSQLVARAEPALRIDLPSGWDTLVAGLIVGGVAGAILSFAAALLVRRSLRRALGLLFDGLIVGAVAGAVFGGARYGWQVGSAIGVTAGLLVWIAAMVGNITRLDISGRFERMRPSTTIETARETLEWVRARTKLAPR